MQETSHPRAERRRFANRAHRLQNDANRVIAIVFTRSRQLGGRARRSRSSPSIAPTESVP
jgi:hypothetical protein